MALTLRITKGSELTYGEMDDNLTHLDGRIDIVETLKMGGDAFLHIQDQKPQGTNGGTFEAGAWRTRDLNTVLTNTIAGASLSNNQITLPAGKYYVEASAPARTEGGASGGSVRARLVTVDDVLLISSNGYAYRADGGSQSFVNSVIYGIMSVSDEIDIRLEHRIQYSSNSWGGGMGSASNFTTEVYSDVRIWRIGDYVAP